MIDFAENARVVQTAQETLNSILAKNYNDFSQYEEVNKIDDIMVSKMVIKRLLDRVNELNGEILELTAAHVKAVETQTRTRGLLDKVIDQMMEDNGLKAHEVIETLLGMGFTTDELIDLKFSADEVLDLEASEDEEDES